MADQASSTIVINAPSDAVLAVIADIDSYPEWTGQIKSAKVTESGADGRPKQATFVMDAGVLKDEYTLAYEWNDSGVAWKLIGKSTVQKSQVVSSSLRPHSDATEVSFKLAFDIPMPMLVIFIRNAQKMIFDSSLTSLM